MILEVVGVEATSLFRFLDGRVLVDLQGTFARPLAGTSPHFLVDGELGGPTKFGARMSRDFVARNLSPSTGAQTAPTFQVSTRPENW